MSMCNPNLFPKTEQEQIRDSILKILDTRNGFQAYKSSFFDCQNNERQNLIKCVDIAVRLIDKGYFEIDDVSTYYSTIFDPLKIRSHEKQEDVQKILSGAQKIADNAVKIVEILEHYYENTDCWNRPFEFEMLLKAVVKNPEPTETAFADPEFYKLCQYFYDIAAGPDDSGYSSLINDHGFSNEQLIDLYKSEDFNTLYLMYGLRFYEKIASETDTTVAELVERAVSDKDFYEKFKSSYYYLKNEEECREEEYREKGYREDYEGLVHEFSTDHEEIEHVTTEV